MTPNPDDPDQQLRTRYEQGASIRDLMRETGRAYGPVRRALLRADTALRPHGKRARRSEGK